MNTVNAFRYKYVQTDISKLNAAVYKKDYTSWPSGIYPRNAKLVQNMKINEINYMNRINNKKHMIISVKPKPSTHPI